MRDNGANRPLRVLLDTNIVIDFFARRHPFCESAEKLLMLGFLGEVEAYISASQITDVFYLLTKGPEKMSSQAAKASLKKLRQSLSVCSVSEADIDFVINSPWEDFEDSCVYRAAANIDANMIVTRNKKDFARSPIQVMNADEFFQYLREKQSLQYAFLEL